MIIRTLDDDAFIERVRKSHRQRKWMAASCIGFGVVLMAAGLWAGHHFDRQARANMERLMEHTDVEPAVTSIAVTTGIKIGSALASTAIGGITVFFAGIGLVLGERKDRLLLHYHQELFQRSSRSDAQPGIPADGSRAAREPRR